MTQSVNVTIATYRRPEQLMRALDSLDRAARHAPVGWSVGVTVVDDDPEGTAHPVVTQFKSRAVVECAYVHCGSQNISVARNAGLESALDGADWVGSIDDDVVVPRDWVATCARAVATGHDAVTGPLVKDFSQGPAWLTNQPFDQLGLMGGTEGEPATVCATGNNWIEAQFLRDRPRLRFSPDLGRTGGEDMEFFRRAVEAGLRPVYSARAAVVEAEPPSRCTLRYQVRRAFWLGISEAQISMRLGSATRRRLVTRAARRALNRGGRRIPAERLPDRGVRFTMAVWAECAGVVLGSAGLELSHK